MRRTAFFSAAVVATGLLLGQAGATPGRGMSAHGEATGGLGENGLASDQTAPGSRSIDGSVTNLGADGVAVVGSAGQQLSLRMDPKTVVTRGGVQVSRSELSPGDEVRATYAVENGEAHALTIHIVQTPVPPPASK